MKATRMTIGAIGEAAVALELLKKGLMLSTSTIIIAITKMPIWSV